MSRKGKMSQIRFKANKRKNTSIRTEHIEKLLREEEEKNRPPVIKRKNNPPQ